MRCLDVGPDRVEEGGSALALRRRVVCLFVGSVACPVLHAREDRCACRAGAGPEQGRERGRRGREEGRTQTTRAAVGCGEGGGGGERETRGGGVAGCRTSMSLRAALAHTMIVRMGASVGTPLVLLTMGMHWRAVIKRKYAYGSLENSSIRIFGAKFHHEYR